MTHNKKPGVDRQGLEKKPSGAVKNAGPICLSLTLMRILAPTSSFVAF